jgi:hypothetical protein
MDGTATATRWPLASGIYQQTTDPKLSSTAGLKNGDIWVDTTHNQLKIYNSNSWTVVGPATGSGTLKTGAEPTDLIDSVAPNGTRRVILNWSDGYVVSVISSGAEFTPQTYPTGMEGFTSIKPGITLTTRNSGASTLIGTADNANKLGGTSATNYLVKNDDTAVGQKITGKVVFETPEIASPGRDGVVIRTTNTPTNEYVQFYKDTNDAVIFNNKDGGKILFKVRGVSTPRVSIDKALITINTSTTVVGSVSVSNTVTAANVSVTSSVQISQNLTVANNVSVTGTTTATGTVKLGSSSGSGTAILPNNTSTYDIGSSSVPFRSLYVNNVYSTGTVYASSYNAMPGTLQLWASNTVPTGWLKCNGSTATTSTYVDLYAAIGAKYGTTSTGHFFLPNLYESSVTVGGTTTTYYIIKT